MARTPRFFYFDLGNVLLGFSHERMIAQMATVLAAPPEAVHEAMFGADGWERAFELGEISGAELAERLRKRFRSDAADDAIAHAAADIFTFRPDVWGILTNLLRQGWPLGILSNTNEWHWQHLEQKGYLLARGLVPVLALSHRLHAMKPDPEIYAKAADLAQVDPQDVFFVDDVPGHVAGAVAAGYDAVLFTTVQQLAADLAVRGAPAAIRT